MKKNIGFDEAKKLIFTSIPQMDFEILPLDKLAGRFAAKDLFSRIDVPSRDISFYDGYALISKDISAAGPENGVDLEITGEIFAGKPEEGKIKVSPGNAVRVTSGAQIPEGADAVIAQEFCKIDGEKLICLNTAEVGRNIIKKGTDLKIGELLIGNGEVLTPPVIGLIAAAGISEAQVYKQPVVAVLATGDEVVAPGEPLGEGKLYSSNLVEICSWLSQVGFGYRTKIISDDKEEIKSAIENILPHVDAFVTSGGAMRSERDLIMKVLDNLKWKGIFHRVRMGPGKAIGFGLLKDKPFFCLPGGPPSNEMAFLQLALPGLLAMQGSSRQIFATTKAKLTDKVTGQKDWTQFIHARFDGTGNSTQVKPAKLASRLQSMAQKEAIIIIPEGIDEIKAGDEIEIQSVKSAGVLTDPGAATSCAGTNPPPIVSFVGKSDSGKTTLIEKVLPVLTGRGYHIGTIKHDAHSFDVDHEGKDSWRHREAGAKAVAISSPAKLFITIKHDRESTIYDIQKYLANTCDLIITEGFKREKAPKIEINRTARSNELICTPEADSLIAVASDQHFDLTVPIFDINDAEAIADFIEKTFLK
ncbi:molybdopterin-guanine dinucleotide biosynthesis protein B [Spirochaetota bacterium]